MAKEAVDLRIESMTQDGEPILEEESPPIVAAIEVEVPVAVPA
jgi:predicted RNase H-like HicB family nuclease